MSSIRRVEIDGQAYIAVSEHLERTRIQPVRLAVGVLAGPAMLVAARAIPAHRAGLRSVSVLAGLLVSAWGLWEWSAARSVIRGRT